MPNELTPKTKPRASFRAERRSQIREELEILNTLEAAAYLNVSKMTIYRLAQSGEIPRSKVGREWRFSRASLYQWLLKGGTAPSEKKYVPQQ